MLREVNKVRNVNLIFLDASFNPLFTYLQAKHRAWEEEVRKEEEENLKKWPLPFAENSEEKKESSILRGILFVESRM